MKRILVILSIIMVLPVFGQHYFAGETNSYFSYQAGYLPTVYYQRGKYEIYLNMSNYIGIRNADTQVPLLRPVIYTLYRVNDTSYSTVDSVILKLKENILK